MAQRRYSITSTFLKEKTPLHKTKKRKIKIVFPRDKARLILEISVRFNNK